MADLLPHLVPPENLVAIGQIVARCDGHPVAGDAAARWTPSSAWEVEWRVEADVSGISSYLGLPRKALRAALLWASPETRTGGTIVQGPLTDGTDLTGSIMGGVMGDSLVLRGVLTADGTPSERVLAPSSPASLLHERERRISLSGSTPRFPVLRLSFAATGLGDPEALWALEVDLTDVEADASVALHLYINDDDPRVDDLLREGGSALTSVLRWDVQRHLVVAAVKDDGVDELGDRLPPRSIGAVIRRALRVCLGSGDLGRARTLFASDYSTFETRIQARALPLGRERSDDAAVPPA